MKRRDFFTAAGATAVFPAAGFSNLEKKIDQPGELLEWIRYQLPTGSKKSRVSDFYKNAALPSLNKMGISPIGVFNVKYGPNAPSLYVLIPHKTFESFLTLPQKMLDNDDLMKAGKDYLDSPFNDPAYIRMEKTLFLAFEDLPTVVVPQAMMNNTQRIYELRIYESHNLKAAKKKIEMFNEGGEIALFKRTGLVPVFFGETLAGPMMPNLTYMVVFNNMEERDKNWGVFAGHPDWAKMREDPQYKDTVSNITDIILSPELYSQV